MILILAAGSSSRMRGADKLLEPVGGEPLLRRQARLAVGTGCDVVVALAGDRPARWAALDGLAVDRVAVPDAAAGMSASLRGGLVRIMQGWPDACGLMVLPGDMPAFTLAALRLVIAAFRVDPSRIARGTTAAGEPGHPVIFPNALLDALAMTTGDEGGRAVIAAHASQVTAVTLPGRMATIDLDTPEDWAAWRASGGVA